MELSAARKILVVIFSVIIAFSTAITLTSLVTNSTLATDSYVIDKMVTDEAVKQCEKQLNAKYQVLEAQSGIPVNVFETVKNEYPVADSVKRTFENSSSSESDELYTDELVEYFTTLCTDYLDGNGLSYKKEYIRITSQKAAEIYSETVGIHNMRTLRDMNMRIKSFTLALIIVSVISAGISVFMISLMFSNKQRAYVCCLSGAAGGAAGAALGALICRLASPFKGFVIEPQVYKSAFIAMTESYFLLVAAAGAAAGGALWLTMFFMNKKLRKSK